MSKRIVLTWSVHAETYEVQTTSSTVAFSDGQPWIDWLEMVNSFSFRSRGGKTCTIRRERVRQASYWYGYRRKSGKVAKRYLGKTADLTFARLEEIADLLDGAGPSEERVDPSLSARFDVQTGTQQSVPPNGVYAPHSLSEPGERSSLQLLLASKFQIPRLSSRLVERLHLIERLKFRKEHALTLICAPAGYGKTTLLTQWLTESKIPAVWLSLGPEDNDPVRFFTYVIAALQRIDTHLGAVALSLLNTPGFSQLEMALTLLINDLVNNLAGDVVLVLDDYHVITDEPLHHALSFLLSHLPPQLHLFLASRTEPSLPLSRLRARGQLIEVRAADLRLSAAETSLFLHAVMGLDLSSATIAALVSRTEGWVAGLQLAAISMQGHPDPTGFIASFTGSHHFVLDYLFEEVFTRQDAHIQTFLLRTSILDRMSGPLCDAVVLDSGASGQTTLEYLERANLFIIPLDNERRWYRYHQLFQDFLRHQLEKIHADTIPMLSGRASLWFEQHNHMPEAIESALSTLDFERAARLIAKVGIQHEFSGEANMLSHWLDQLPDELIRSHGRLCLLRCWSLSMKSQIPAAESWLSSAKEALLTEALSSFVDQDDKELLGSFFMLNAYLAIAQGDVQRCVESANEALTHLPAHQMYTRSFVTLHKGFAYALSGNLSEAAEVYQQSAQLGLFINNSYIAITSLCSLATMQGQWGQFREAKETYEQALRLSSREKEPYPFASMAHIGLSAILYEWNNLISTRQHLEEGIALSTQWGNRDYIIYGNIVLAAVNQAEGRADEAALLMEKVNQDMRECQLPIWGISLVSAYQTRLLLMQGNREGATLWASTHYLGDYEHVTKLRLLLAQNQPGRVLSMVEHQLPIVEAVGRSFQVIELLMLQALAYYQESDIGRSLLALERALSLAQVEGYIRLFVDAGEPMSALLFKARDRQQRRRNGSPPISSNYLRTLLGALGKDLPVDDARGQEESRLAPLPSVLQSLSNREIEIVHCVASGMSNDQIAQQLVVAKSTVEWHLKNVYSKLGIHTRAQLVLKVKGLGSPMS